MFSFELNDNQKKIFSNLRICEISPLFMNKLGLTLSDAQKFARFLVEEPDENAEKDPDNAKIVYDPNRKANLQMVSVRLQLYTPYAKIFTKDQEQKAKELFTKVFAKKHIKFIRLVEQQGKGQDHGVINFSLFKGLVH